MLESADLNNLAGITVDTRPGIMPELWSFPTIYIANVDCIFYGDPEKTQHLKNNVAGFSGYGSRLVPILGLLYGSGPNVLILQAKPDQSLVEYFGNILGLTMPQMVLLGEYGCGTLDMNFEKNSALMELLASHPARVMDGFVTDLQMETLAATLGKSLVNTHAASRKANDKILLHRFLARAGFPLLDGGEVKPGAPLAECLAGLKRQGYGRAVIRSALGASGFGMFVADLSDDRHEDVPAFMSGTEPVLAQGWLEEGKLGVQGLISPSVQFFCRDDRSVTIFDVTEQLLSQSSVHEGNISPSPAFKMAEGNWIYDELIRQAVDVARWVSSTGYRGTGSIDFLVYRQAGELQVRVSEVNARVTGATYPSLLARHFLPGKAWLMRNFSFGSCLSVRELINIMEARNLLFERGSSSGVLPINFITGDGGWAIKAQLLFLAGKPDECLKMIGKFVDAMPPGCVYDRD